MVALIFVEDGQLEFFKVDLKHSKIGKFSIQNQLLV